MEAVQRQTADSSPDQYFRERIFCRVRWPPRRLNQNSKAALGELHKLGMFPDGDLVYQVAEATIRLET
jgi:hypothetical protein